jgi:pyridoxal phosphate enzyme (YggS family)
MSFAERLQTVEDRIAKACALAGRARGDVELVAVSKTRSVDEVRAAVSAGLDLFGENRVQEAMMKIPELSGRLRWHLIGHLQTNKVKAALHAGFELIHSVDSEKLLRLLEAEAKEQGLTQGILLQVNVSGEGSKSGLPPGRLISLLEVAAACPHLDVRGLMTIPPLAEDPEKAAPHFARLRGLRDQARAASGFDLPHLSMGMSHDLEVAIREGATLVRVGTDLFGPRNHAHEPSEG